MEGLPDEDNVPLHKYGTEDLQANTHLSKLEIDSSMQKVHEGNVSLQKHGAGYLQANTHLSKLEIDSSMQKLHESTELYTIEYSFNKNSTITLITLHAVLSDFAMLPFNQRVR